MIDRLQAINLSVIKALFHPLPLSEQQRYQRRLQQLSTQVFMKLSDPRADSNDSEIPSQVVNDIDLTPIVSLKDIPSVAMDALLYLFSERDNSLATSYYTRHQDDKNKAKESTYSARQRDFFIPSTMTWTEALQLFPTFYSIFYRLFKPVFVDDRWYLIIVNLRDWQVYIIDPYPSHISESIEAIKGGLRYVISLSTYYWHYFILIVHRCCNCTAMTYDV